MSEVIKRYKVDGDDPVIADDNGHMVFVSDLLSGHVLEHEGVQWKLVKCEPDERMGRAGERAGARSTFEADMIYRAMIGAGE